LLVCSTQLLSGTAAEVAVVTGLAAAVAAAPAAVETQMGLDAGAEAGLWTQMLQALQFQQRVQALLLHLLLLQVLCQQALLLCC
jgi:hypothetical protein